MLGLLGGSTDEISVQLFSRVQSQDRIPEDHRCENPLCRFGKRNLTDSSFLVKLYLSFGRCFDHKYYI